MKVFVSGIDVIEDKYRDDSYWMVGRFQSGVEVVIDDYYYDLREWIGQSVDMLLSFMRSPYSELERGIRNDMFTPEKYYSVEVVEELVNDEVVVSENDGSVVILTGEYIDSYIVPEKWIGFNHRGPFEMLFKEPSALKTEDGTFLLYPFHSRRAIPIEQVPRTVTMVGSLKLEAWKTIQ